MPQESIKPGKLTMNSNQRSDYWSAFKSVFEEDPGSLKAPKSSEADAVNFKVREHRHKTCVHISALIKPKEQSILVELYLIGPLAKGWYDQIVPHRKEIEAITGPLYWEGIGERKLDHVISLLKPEENPTNKADWRAQHIWLRDKVKLFHQAFLPRIKQLKDVPPSLKET